MCVHDPTCFAVSLPTHPCPCEYCHGPRRYNADRQELEKLISYSATPTAVWRRTGDLVYANPEFCSLLGKQQSELLSGKTYIYHLFAKQSYVAHSFSAMSRSTAVAQHHMAIGGDVIAQGHIDE